MGLGEMTGDDDTGCTDRNCLRLTTARMIPIRHCAAQTIILTHDDPMTTQLQANQLRPARCLIIELVQSTRRGNAERLGVERHQVETFQAFWMNWIDPDFHLTLNLAAPFDSSLNFF